MKNHENFGFSYKYRPILALRQGESGHSASFSSHILPYLCSHVNSFLKFFCVICFFGAPKKFFSIKIAPKPLFTTTTSTTIQNFFVQNADKISDVTRFFLTCVFYDEIFDKKSCILNIYKISLLRYNDYAVGGTKSTAHAQRTKTPCGISSL